MPRSGVSELPLHGGDAPRWLFERMVQLGSAISEIIMDEYGTEELIRRMSDPYWFQAYSCVLGFDWHSSGTTTVTCGAMKVAMQNHPEIRMAGGKGALSRNAPHEITHFAEDQGISMELERKLKYSSRMSAKVDNTALQDGHRLYHHVILFDNKGNWSVIQQGMSAETGYARRYQWFSGAVREFVIEPHTGISGSKSPDVLDMTAKESESSRRTSLDLVKDGTDRLEREILVVEKGQSTLMEWNGEKPVKLHMPRNINWNVLRNAYEVQPRNYEELIAIEGIGPSTVRALAMIGELVYGSKPSWKDPVKYSFTVGGKDGVPYPVDRKAMDESIDVLRAGIAESKLGDKQKLEALQRLRRYAPPDYILE